MFLACFSGYINWQTLNTRSCEQNELHLWLGIFHHALVINDLSMVVKYFFLRAQRDIDRYGAQAYLANSAGQCRFGLVSWLGTFDQLRLVRIGSYRLTVRTSGSHPDNPGSIPGTITT